MSTLSAPLALHSPEYWAVPTNPPDPTLLAIVAVVVVGFVAFLALLGAQVALDRRRTRRRARIRVGRVVGLVHDSPELTEARR